VRGNTNRFRVTLFFGAGAGHQIPLVVPSLKLIAVRNGGALADEAEYDSALDAHFFDPLLAAVQSGRGD
jgi:hypothetical protein